MSDGALERGKRLRSALEEAYRHLNDYPRTEFGPGRVISVVVTSIIPPGGQFEEAETILKAAGFSVGEHPAATPTCGRNCPKD